MLCDEERLMALFEASEGWRDINGCLTAEFYYDDEHESPVGINVMKDGDLCWSITCETLILRYVTRHLGESDNEI